MMDIIEAQVKAQREKKAYALVTLVKAEGSTPRGAGSKLLVFSDGFFYGSIGGGVLEKQVLFDAIKCIKDKEHLLKEYENRAEEALSPCGGKITVFIESHGPATELIICGAGHVGREVVKLGKALDFHITVLDTRDTDLTRDNTKEADNLIICKDFFSGLESLETGPKVFYLICSHSHESDLDALSAALQKEAAYIGMLGSRKKIDTLFGKLREKGYSQEQLAKVRAPVGLDIGGERPAEIALSILSQIQMVRYGATGSSIENKA